MLSWARGWPARRRARMSGGILVLTTLLIAAAAVNTGTNLLYMILGGALSLFIISAVLRVVNFSRVRVSRTMPKSAFRDQAVNADIRIENRKFLLPAVGLRIELADRPGTILGYALKVPARRCAVVNTKLSFPRRGVQRVAPVDVISSFPFGFSDRWSRHDDGAEIVVYPRVRPVRASILEHMRGERSMASAPSADGDEFYALREYVHGDDIRRISWRASARLGRWMVREMSKDKSRYVIFALDTRWLTDDPDFLEHFEEAIELIASFAIMLLQKQYDVSIETPNASLEGGEGTGQERRVLEFLARIESVDPAAFPSFEDLVRVLEHRAASVIYVSPDPSRWGRHGAPDSLRALDPREVIYA